MMSPTMYTNDECTRKGEGLEQLHNRGWSTRIEYLHETTNPSVKNFNPKLLDVGFAKLGPLMGGDYPMKTLYQALEIPAMCLQEEASTYPLIIELDTSDENKDKDEEKAVVLIFFFLPFLANFLYNIFTK